ncbi:hypothetical protein ElyMa_000267700 [Elysia marginata]|uniref:DUF4758 domain-containing protein n=1 Tax=Elysia marginata TaxID=1093978 RepID=A0AAV4F410_9GAST|nr:hypothetical protein ElyMa_000267700 [Elysia marginata]
MKDHNSNSPVHKVNMISASGDPDVVMNDHVIPNSVPIPTSIATTTAFPTNKVVTKHVTYGDSTIRFMTPEQSPMTPDIGVKDLLATEMSKSSPGHEKTPSTAVAASPKRGHSPSRMALYNNNYYTNNVNSNSNNNNGNQSPVTASLASASRRSGSTSPGSYQQYSVISATETKTEIKPAHFAATATDPELQGLETKPGTGLYGRKSRRSPTPPPVVMRTSATSLDRLSWKGYRPPSEEYYDVLHPEPKDQT